MVNLFHVTKAIHIVSSTVLFGTTGGTVFYKYMVDRSGSLPAIRALADNILVALWLFTIPALLVQIATGIMLTKWVGYSFGHGWVAKSLLLYGIAALCWIPVAELQYDMRKLARAAQGTDLPVPYVTASRLWLVLYVAIGMCLLLVFWLMVHKPA
jgi:uncharacterized membrane protein